MKRPNVVYLFPDQLRAASVPAYVREQLTHLPELPIETPHLDKLRSQSTMVTQMVSACPLCTPYRAMMLTGRHPQTTGHIVNSTVTRHDEVGLGDAFAAAGYDTAWVGKWHLHRGAFPANNVPDFVPEGRDRFGFRHWRAYNQHLRFFDGFVNSGDWGYEQWDDYETAALNRHAIDYLENHWDETKPFLLCLSPQPPHDCWEERMAPERMYGSLPDTSELRRLLPANVADPDRDAAAAAYREYLAMILAVDEMVGELTAYLDAAGLADDTILVFTSDHGTQGGAHGVEFFRKKRPYEESLHVPLLVRWPGEFEAGGTSDALTSPVDLFPTLCSLCGVPIPRTVEGIDQADAWRGGGSAREDVFIFNFGSAWDYFEDGLEWRGVRTRRHTYVEHLDGRVELFDRNADPLQLDNLADEPGSAPLLAGLAQRLREH